MTVNLPLRDAYPGLIVCWARGRRDFARLLALAIVDFKRANPGFFLTREQMANVLAVIRDTDPAGETA